MSSNRVKVNGARKCVSPEAVSNTTASFSNDLIWKRAKRTERMVARASGLGAQAQLNVLLMYVTI